MVLVMLLTAVIDFFAAQIIERGHRKLGILLSVCSNLGLLAFFKYFNFALENYNSFITLLGFHDSILTDFPYITLPIGISFYTFQTLSYTIDVYRGHTKANTNFIDFAAFVTIFPQLIAGPIVRYVDVERQLKIKNISTENFAMGIRRFIIGLSKKMLLANPMASVADNVFSAPFEELSTGWCWIGIIAYSFQIYFDFSGYSDMAIGLGKMFGFDFLENFNYPYISRSIREFWQRWHISLSTWFRDYIYIPLGGSRVAPRKVYRNLLIVFFITGLWHGASWNFIIWGLFHGAFLIFERIGLNNVLNRIWSPLTHMYTLIVVVVGWVLFRTETLTDSITFLSQMFSIHSGDTSRISYLNFFLANNEYFLVFILSIICSTPIIGVLWDRIVALQEKSIIPSILDFSVHVTLLVMSASYVAAETYNPFIYFRF